MRRVSQLLPAIALAALMGGIAAPSAAQGVGHREGTWEFQLPLTYTESWTANADGGAKADVNAGFGLGFGFAYNFNDHLQLGGSFNWSSRSYDATLVDSTGVRRNASGTLESSTIALNGVYFLFAGPLTPYASASIGSTFVDSNIPNGQSSTGCWWDPWWGYICNTYVPTKTETDVSYNVGLGVRWDISRVMALQGGYNRLWLDSSHSTPEFNNWTLSFIFRM